MEGKFIQVPANLEDSEILKRFLNELVDKLNSNYLVSYPLMFPKGYSGTVPVNYAERLGNTNNSILEATARVNALSGTVKNYITKELKIEVLQNSKDVATVTQQFGTFYDTATAAAWYGLTVKSGELISGFTVGGVDSDTTVPGTAGSFFSISSDKFSVGRAIEDISDPAELAYVQANGLPYGTMYNANTQSIIPAFIVEWNGTGYDIFFNGKVTFTNVSGTLTQAQQEAIKASYIDNDTGWTDDTTANNAMTLAGEASTDATAALNQLANIASDSKFTPSEKQATNIEVQAIMAEYPKVMAGANAWSITTTAYSNAYDDLIEYISPLLADLSTTSDITYTSFISAFNSYYDERQNIADAITVAIDNVKVSGSDIYTAGTTTIDGGNITTNSITVDQIDTNTINTLSLSTLSLQTSGTKAFSNSYPNNTGNFFIDYSTTLTSSVLLTNASYGSGFNALRCLLDIDQVFIVGWQVTYTKTSLSNTAISVYIMSSTNEILATDTQLTISSEGAATYTRSGTVVFKPGIVLPDAFYIHVAVGSSVANTTTNSRKIDVSTRNLV